VLDLEIGVEEQKMWTMMLVRYIQIVAPYHIHTSYCAALLKKCETIVKQDEDSDIAGYTIGAIVILCKGIAAALFQIVSLGAWHGYSETMFLLTV